MHHEGEPLRRIRSVQWHIRCARFHHRQQGRQQVVRCLEANPDKRFALSSERLQVVRETVGAIVQLTIGKRPAAIGNGDSIRRSFRLGLNQLMEGNDRADNLLGFYSNRTEAFAAPPAKFGRGGEAAIKEFSRNGLISPLAKNEAEPYCPLRLSCMALGGGRDSLPHFHAVWEVKISRAGLPGVCAIYLIAKFATAMNSVRLRVR